MAQAGDKGKGCPPPDRGLSPVGPTEEGGGRWIEVGRVAGPQGIRGKVRVTMYSGDAAGVLRVSRVALARGNDRGMNDRTEFDVGTVQRAGGCAVFSLRGIDSPEAAGSLRGARVSVRRDALPPLQEGEFYWEDAVGCALVDVRGAVLGEVTGVLPGPAHDWLVVRRGVDEAYLPVVAAFVRSIDVPSRRIVASPPEGW